MWIWQAIILSQANDCRLCVRASDGQCLRDPAARPYLSLDICGFRHNLALKRLPWHPPLSADEAMLGIFFAGDALTLVDIHAVEQIAAKDEEDDEAEDGGPAAAQDDAGEGED